MSVDKINPPAPPSKSRFLQVSWYSGTEILDLHAIENLQDEAEFITTEVRFEENMVVTYNPVFRRTGQDKFSLTYSDPGKWKNGEVNGEAADGDLGRAEYELKRNDEGTAKWTCKWIPAEPAKRGSRPKCTVIDPDVDRPFEFIVRLARDQSFRRKIFGNNPRCAITGETDQRVLDAAHILQVRDKGVDSVENGIILRKDLHALFDAHVISITEQGVFKMDPILESYKEIAGLLQVIHPVENLEVIRDNIISRNRLIENLK